MYGVMVCVAAKVRMIPIPILYCLLSTKLIIKSMLLLSMMLLMES